MRQLHGKGLDFILGATTIVFLAAQPVKAQVTKITDVQLKTVNGGVNVVLKTSSGSRPQIFTTQRGKTLVADIINTQLRLPKGNSFRKDNPIPGIASIEVTQLDTNSIRVLAIGTDSAPNTQPLMRGTNDITLGLTPSAGTTASAPTPPQAPTPNPSPSVPSVVPNPQVSIDGTPAQTAGPGQGQTQAPPFLPRAVAPPVGDIAISNIDASPSSVDLGTQERVPRLVLRDAPVREVLSLLARAAGLNLAYSGTETTGGQGGQTTGQTISLDIENEPVQDVFNYVLRLSGLEANRSGRTVFVGPRLPNSTRDVVMRNLRLNQVTVGTALNFLVSLGAESAVNRERQVTNVSAVPVGNGVAPITQTQTTTETRVETQRIDFQDSKPLLRGLQALGDERTNSLTLIGPPRLVEIAMAQLTQLDVRRRQVAVNVKIIDVNLLNTKDVNTSFSFGIGNNFFVNDGSAAALNFGGSRPATSAEARTSVTSTPVISNPITGTPFLDVNNRLIIPGGGSGTTIVNNSSNPITVGGVTVQPGSVTVLPNRDATTYQPIPPSSTNPLQPGITDVNLVINDIITINPDGRISVSPGSTGTVTSALPSLYQFPKRFLLSLQSQVQSGNAKILTDPTLIVQEGQTANVNLTQEVVGNIKNEITRGDGSSTQIVTAEKEYVGLTLAVKVDRIDDNGFVSLSVAPTVKAPQAATNLNLGTGSQQIFLVSERSLNSGLIRLRDGQTLILSGIIQDTDRTTVSKIPILGDIPLIGSLFRSTNKQNQRNEVVVLLTPQIMDDSEKSSYGYSYTPSPEVRQILERRGLQVPK
ncbi:general secretion pathway protein GspD [Fischerella thermalis CCMEE 5198]|uniref:type IV pilus secretin family protein n=1 Tax=Fischerella thermalis TaxID=372787 RepID=UPI000C80609B|nr:type IV pilus secretin family protein [Fischerella thermalis]PMB07195.1 general secretion pathway protein GspD [Fischerella thermalis CCMEE 5196]PMB23133.1 general secretion pathway protein GspD [Fischerella thermalis CCMEE 5198]